MEENVTIGHYTVTVKSRWSLDVHVFAIEVLQSRAIPQTWKHSLGLESGDHKMESWLACVTRLGASY